MSSSVRSPKAGCTIRQGCCLSCSTRPSCREKPASKMVEIIDRLLHQASVPRHVSGFHQVKQAPHLYYYFHRFTGVPQPYYLFPAELQFHVSLFKRIELSNVFKESFEELRIGGQHPQFLFPHSRQDVRIIAIPVSRQNRLSRPYAACSGPHRPCPLPSSLSATCDRKGSCVRP